MKKTLPVALAVGTLVVYCAAIVVGAGLRRWGPFWPDRVAQEPWRIERTDGLPKDQRELVEYGRQLFNETPVYGARWVKGRVACRSCHLEGGIAAYAAPVVGAAQAYPQYSTRARRTITLEDRVEECMTRSENGAPLETDGREMKALLAYIDWLSEPHAGQRKFVGRGLEKLPVMVPDVGNGARVYAAQCAGCHGENGEGRRPQFPPLWGERAFNDGAGMNGVDKMAAFVQYNMPHNRKGILTAQEAYDVAGFLHAKPRPPFDRANEKF
jgi:thiosulfate dehydrogenase